MIVLIIAIIIFSTGVGIWLKHTAQQRSSDRSERLQQKQQALLETLNNKNKEDGN